MSNLEPVKAKKPTRKEKIEVKSRMKNMLMFLPNMVKLLGKLMTDARVPLVDRALFVGAIAYLIMPLDLIPDFLPFIGQVDDTYLIALSLLRLINRTDESIVREHWDGGGDVVSLAHSIANLAPMLLPKRVTRVLTSEVELTPNAQAIISTVEQKKPLFVENPKPETPKNIEVDSRSAMTN